ncbi:MAG: hypothetical protein WC613_04320 [Candidatus Aenigmatarchaeota archaeon]
MPKKVLIAFGSPSDLDKVPIITKTGDAYHLADGVRGSDTDYYMSVASAHRTPETVERHARTGGWDAVIAVAGMKNLLVDAYLQHTSTNTDKVDNLCHTNVGTLLVALPMDDKVMCGVSSMLSSSETPPGYPIGMVGLGNLPAAVRFVNYALQPHEKVSLHSRGSTIKSDRAMYDVAKMLKRLGVDYQFPTQIEPDTLNLLAYDNPLTPAIADDVPVICTYNMPVELRRNGRFDLAWLGLYLDGVNKHDNYVHVGVANGGNLGLYAAKIVARHDPDVRGRIADLIVEGREKYNDFKDVRQL